MGRAIHNVQSAKTQCPQGHSYSGTNLRIYHARGGWKHRYCRMCDQIRSKEKRDRNIQAGFNSKGYLGQPTGRPKGTKDSRPRRRLGG